MTGAPPTEAGGSDGDAVAGLTISDALPATIGTTLSGTIRLGKPALFYRLDNLQQDQVLSFGVRAERLAGKTCELVVELDDAKGTWLGNQGFWGHKPGTEAWKMPVPQAGTYMLKIYARCADETIKWEVDVS